MFKKYPALIVPFVLIAFVLLIGAVIYVRQITNCSSSSSQTNISKQVNNVSSFAKMVNDKLSTGITNAGYADKFSKLNVKFLQFYPSDDTMAFGKDGTLLGISFARVGFLDVNSPSSKQNLVYVADTCDALSHMYVNNDKNKIVITGVDLDPSVWSLDESLVQVASCLDSALEGIKMHQDSLRSWNVDLNHKK